MYIHTLPYYLTILFVAIIYAFNLPGEEVVKI